MSDTSEEDKAERTKKNKEIRNEATLHSFYQEPFFSEMPRFMELSRRNLIAFSVLSIMIALWGPETIKAKEIKVWDITLNPQHDINVYVILTAALFYQIFHFFAAAIIYLKENRIRITGTIVRYKTDNGATYETYDIDTNDHPPALHQASLAWWISKHLERLATKENDLRDSYTRLSISLMRFDTYFRLFGREQVFSRVFLDVILPISVGFVSLCMIWPWPEILYGWGVVIPFSFFLSLSIYGLKSFK